MMKFQRLLYQFFIFIFSICYFISCCQANKVSVCGKDGWVLKPSETYDQWSGRNRFQVNDSIVFKYKKGSDSVLVVNKDDYNSCNTKNPIKKMEDGNSEFKFDRSGPFYFISGINDHCAKGQKLLVTVLAVRKNSPPIPNAPVPQAQPPTANPPKGLGPISPSPKSQAPSPAEMSPISPSPKSQAPSPAEISPISPSPKSQAPSPAEISPISPNSSSPSPSPYAVSPPSPPNSPVPAAAPAPGTSASSPPSPGPAPSGGGSSTNSSSSPQAQNQKSYAMTVTPSSFLVLSVALLVTIVLSGEFLGGGI